MTSTPPDPNQPGSTPPAGGGATPPPPPGGGATPPPPGGGATPPPAYGGQPGGYSQQPPLSDSDQRLWATLAHVGGILFSFIAGLVVWLIFKERGRFVEEQAKEALNFQITIAIGYVISSFLIVVIIGAFLLPIVGLIALIFGILAGIAANKGEAYRYPFALRLVK